MRNWFRKPDDPPPPVLDTAYLARLAKHIGLQEMHELLDDGLLELSDRIERLGDLAASQQHAEIAALTHDIAGVAGHLGLSALSQAAVGANQLARAEDPPPAGEVVQGVISHRDPAMTAIADFRSNRPSDGDLPDGP